MQPDVGPIGMSSATGFGGNVFSPQPFYDTSYAGYIPNGGQSSSSSSSSRNVPSIDDIPPYQWDPSQVGRWLCRIGMEEYCFSFESQAISGERLLRLSDADLVQLSVGKLGHRYQILSEIESLKNGEKKLNSQRRQQQPQQTQSQQPQQQQSVPEINPLQIGPSYEEEPSQPHTISAFSPPPPPDDVAAVPTTTTTATARTRSSNWTRYVKACIPPVPSDITYTPVSYNFCGKILLFVGGVIVLRGKRSSGRSRSALLTGILFLALISVIIGALFAMGAIPWVVLQDGSWPFYPLLVITDICYVAACFLVLVATGDMLGGLPSSEDVERCMSKESVLVVITTIISLVVFHVALVAVYIVTELYSSWKFVFYIFGSFGSVGCWGLAQFIVFGALKLWRTYQNRLSQM